MYKLIVIILFLTFTSQPLLAKRCQIPIQFETDFSQAEPTVILGKRGQKVLENDEGKQKFEIILKTIKCIKENQTKLWLNSHKSLNTKLESVSDALSEWNRLIAVESSRLNEKKVLENNLATEKEALKSQKFEFTVVVMARKKRESEHTIDELNASIINGIVDAVRDRLKSDPLVNIQDAEIAIYPSKRLQLIRSYLYLLEVVKLSTTSPLRISQSHITKYADGSDILILGSSPLSNNHSLKFKPFISFYKTEIANKQKEVSMINREYKAEKRTFRLQLLQSIKKLEKDLKTINTELKDIRDRKEAMISSLKDEKPGELLQLNLQSLLNKIDQHRINKPVISFDTANNILQGGSSSYGMGKNTIRQAYIGSMKRINEAKYFQIFIYETEKGNKTETTAIVILANNLIQSQNIKINVQEL